MLSSKFIAAEALRDTLRDLEQNTDISPDDLSFSELKRILLLKIATLEWQDQAERAATTGPLPTMPSDAN